jgi:hypothetical protein
LDEAGISSKEPTAVVAEIIVHADRQWRHLDGELNAIKRKFSIPERILFHAKDLFQGTGKFTQINGPYQLGSKF